MNTRGGHYIVDFAGGLSKALFISLNNETHLDFLIGANPWCPQFCPACLLSKIEQARWADMGDQGVCPNKNPKRV